MPGHNTAIFEKERQSQKMTEGFLVKSPGF